MIRLLTIPLALSCAVAVAGCPLDKLAKPDEPSAFQQHVERTAAITAPYTEPTAGVVPAVARIAAVQIAAEPPCSPTFRINQCQDGQSVAWFYEPDPEPNPEPPPQPIVVAEVEPVVVPPPVVEECVAIFRVKTCPEVTP